MFVIGIYHFAITDSSRTLCVSFVFSSFIDLHISFSDCNKLKMQALRSSLLILEAQCCTSPNWLHYTTIHYVLGLQFAAVSVVPNVTVMLVNDSSYFNCSTTSETVEWLFISDEYLQPSVIYSYGTVKPFYQDRFRVEKYENSIEKQFNLVLQSIAKDDPGRYICRDPDTRNEEGEAQLIVIGTCICS